MKKFSLFLAVLSLLVLTSSCIVYGQNMDFVQGSHLWQEDQYLLGVPKETRCSAVAENFKLEASITGADGKPVSGTALAGTGMRVKAASELTLVVYGDINGDGRLTSTDYVQLKKAFSGQLQLADARFEAADVSCDDRITSTDYIRIKKCFGGLADLYEDMSASPYVSRYEYQEYDTSGYRMDRDRINIGVFDFAKGIRDDAHMQAYKEEFGGDFIVLGNNSKKFYDLCEKYQVGFIAANKNLTRYTYGSAPEKLDPTSFADFETKLAAYNDNYEYCWGDDIFDEPNAVYYDWMKGVTERYQEKFSDRLIYFNLHPFAPGGPSYGHGAANYREYIAQYIEKINTDYISFDIYPFNNQFPGMHPNFLENLDVVASACRETGRDFWLISQAGATGMARKMNEYQLSWQMYTALAYGAKTIIHACYTPCWWEDGTSLVNLDGTYTDLWYAAKNLNAEVKGLSDVYMQYDSLGVFGLDQSSFVARQIRSQNVRALESGLMGARGFKDIEAERGLLVGSFEKSNGNGYAMMLVETSDPYDGDNGTNQIAFKTAVSEGVTVTAHRGSTSEVLTPVNGVYTVELTNGQGCFITVE